MSPWGFYSKVMLSNVLNSKTCLSMKDLQMFDNTARWLYVHYICDGWWFNSFQAWTSKFSSKDYWNSDLDARMLSGQPRNAWQCHPNKVKGLHQNDVCKYHGTFVASVCSSHVHTSPATSSTNYSCLYVVVCVQAVNFVCLDVVMWACDLYDYLKTYTKNMRVSIVTLLFSWTIYSCCV
jgi:hypothetical protein